ncbi:MAG: hypothetical protein ABI763_02955 [Bacteroidota bacterium]
MIKLIPILLLLFSFPSAKSIESIASDRYIIEMDSSIHRGDDVMVAFISLAIMLYILYLIDVSVQKNISRYANETN